MTIPVTPPVGPAEGQSVAEARSAALDRCYAALVVLSHEMRPGPTRSRVVRQLLDLKDIADSLRRELQTASARSTR